MYCKNATAAISSAVTNQFGNFIAYTPNKRQAKPNAKKNTRNQNNTCSSALIALLPASVNIIVHTVTVSIDGIDAQDNQRIAKNKSRKQFDGESHLVSLLAKNQIGNRLQLAGNGREFSPDRG